MFSKEYRLKKKYQFNYVYRVGRSVGSTNLVLYFSQSKNKNVKVGISVSKKLGHAVTRNLVKRRIRECVIPYLQKINPNFNVVFIAKTSAAEASFAELQKDVNYLLKKANILCG